MSEAMPDDGAPPERVRAVSASGRRWARDVGAFARMLAVALPPALVAVWVVLRPGVSSKAWAALAVALGASALIVWAIRHSLARRLRTVSSVLASYREGDFSIRARRAAGDELLADVVADLNQLGDTLRERRLGEIEAWALLRKVMAEVDVVVLAFDDDRRLRLANDAAARLLRRPSSAILGEHASVLGLAELLDGAAPRIVKDAPALEPTTSRRNWELRRGSFRLSGEPHTLVVLSDMSSALRDNEREAWRRLIRVMGHEINNSLAPIRSISDTLSTQLRRVPRPADWDEDLAQGLSVIARRSEALGRFMTGYATLARLPPPRRSPVHLPTLVRKIVALEQRTTVDLVASPDVTLDADPDQLEQALINLVANAVDASREAQRTGVRVSWAEVSSDGFVEIAIEDDGPGVSDSANLFVPFFTTKPSGSGIGLALSRQIADAHDGQLSLSSRPGGVGAVALLRLPLVPIAKR